MAMLHEGYQPFRNMHLHSFQISLYVWEWGFVAGGAGGKKKYYYAVH